MHAMCLNLPQAANQCSSNDPVKDCIEEAGRKAANARSREDDRHNSIMPNLLKPSTSQLIGGGISNICSAL